ncbi:MAG: hypothetical protein IT566_14360 [Rhodospirillaceae bacterium]|nr:hypothetical protein [Rhodospirillaceae bacterium]
MRLIVSLAALCAGVIIAFAGGDLRAADGKPPKWNPNLAADYLDHAEERWASWPRASLERGTFCVSCHTSSLYALARPALRSHLKQRQTVDSETKLIENVVKRVSAWNEVAPYYPDQRYGLPKTSESRGSEAVINALVLSTRDFYAGTLSDETRHAFKNMWNLQMHRGDLSGAWAWMNFRLDPWEGEQSAFYGASLAALAVGAAPQNYAADPDIQNNIQALAEYLQRNADAASLFNSATALWASRVMPGILKPEQKDAITNRILKAQAADGGWSLSAMGEWSRRDDSPAETASDGYASALAVLALRASESPAAGAGARRGVAWLTAHQDKDGKWTARAVNKRRETSDDNLPGYFMTDAATAMAVLALTGTP